MAKNSLKQIRSLISNDKFGVGSRNYLASLYLAKAAAEEPSFLKAMSDILEKDETSRSTINIYRCSLIFYINYRLLKREIPPVVIEKAAILKSHGGSLLNGKPGSLSDPNLPYDLLLPFGLYYGTSSDYFSEVDFQTDLTKADKTLRSFFIKIGTGRFDPNTHGWVDTLPGPVREIYENTLTHAFLATRAPTRYVADDHNWMKRANFWFFSFRRFAYDRNAEHLRSLFGFDRYADSLQKKVLFFVAINIADDGPGMVPYFNESSRDGRKVETVSQIINGRLSSTGLKGAGYGITNAISKLLYSRGLFTISSIDNQYSIFQSRDGLPIRQEKHVTQGLLAGTNVDMLVPIFA